MPVQRNTALPDYNVILDVRQGLSRYKPEDGQTLVVVRLTSKRAVVAVYTAGEVDELATMAAACCLLDTGYRVEFGFDPASAWRHAAIVGRQSAFKPKAKWR